MSNTLLESVVKKNRARLIPFMLALYVLAFLDRSNIALPRRPTSWIPVSATKPMRWGQGFSLWCMPFSGCRPTC